MPSQTESALTASALTDSDLDRHLALAGRLADAAAAVTLGHFRGGALALANKEAGAGFDPVTAADKGAEAAIREILARERPEDGIFGEEEESVESRSGLTWVLDPIDGTRSFMSGVPLWGTLIALDDGARGRIGVIDQPYTGERFAAIRAPAGDRAWLERGGVQRPIETRQGVALAEATMFSTDPFMFAGAEADAFHALRARARLTRYGADCYAYALLAMGQIDLVVETGLHAYDIAAIVPIIEAAGGRVTDWEGRDCRWGGRAVAAGNAALHEEVLEILSGA